MPKDWTHMTVRMDKDKAEKFAEMHESKSGSARRILETWMEVEDDHDIGEDFQQIELAVLKTYLGAVEKNISTLKVQRDKLQKHVDEIEKRADNGEQGEVLFEVDLRMKQETL